MSQLSVPVVVSDDGGPIHVPVPWQEIACVVDLQRLLDMGDNEIVVLSRTS
jgi:hypothetical protein